MTEYLIGEDAGSFTVLAGYGVNMRTALQAENMRMYDEDTARYIYFQL